MITFHNDHLAPPALCKLLYDTVPVELHKPVTFVPHTKEYWTRGVHNGPDIDLNLQSIYYNNRTDFAYWCQLLRVAYHEFGHAATRHMAWAANRESYERHGREYKFCEQLAIDWANRKMLELAEHDKRICQPKRLGQYFDGRDAKFKSWARSQFDGGLPNNFMLNVYRKFKSGGQFSTGEVAFKIGATYLKESTSRTDEARFMPRYKLVKRLASDLAYIYVDSANRTHMFFAWGDLLEIKRRFEEYKIVRRGAGDPRAL